MKIFVVNAIHFSVPGTVIELHATMASAAASAALLVNLLLDYNELPQDATAQNWEERCKAARMAQIEDCGDELDPDSLSEDPIGDALGEYNGDVWITEEELKGLNLKDWRAAQGETTDEKGPIDQRPWNMEMNFNDLDGNLQIHFTHPDLPEGNIGNDQSVMIEIADNCVVVRCYDPDHEEPLNIRIGKSDIVTDHDRDENISIFHR